MRASAALVVLAIAMPAQAEQRLGDAGIRSTSALNEYDALLDSRSRVRVLPPLTRRLTADDWAVVAVAAAGASLIGAGAGWLFSGRR